MSFPKSRNKVLCRATTTTRLALQGLGTMFRSSFEVMITGALGSRNRARVAGVEDAVVGGGAVRSGQGG